MPLSCSHQIVSVLFESCCCCGFFLTHYTHTHTQVNIIFGHCCYCGGVRVSLWQKANERTRHKFQFQSHKLIDDGASSSLFICSRVATRFDSPSWWGLVILLFMLQLLLRSNTHFCEKQISHGFSLMNGLLTDLSNT